MILRAEFHKQERIKKEEEEAKQKEISMFLFFVLFC